MEPALHATWPRTRGAPEAHVRGGSHTRECAAVLGTGLRAGDTPSLFAAAARQTRRAPRGQAGAGASARACGAASSGSSPAVNSETQVAAHITVPGSQAAQPKLVVQGLSRFEPPFGHILDSVSFQVQPGELFGLIGPSGSGKSTLLRALNRLWEPARGTVLLDAKDVRDLPVQQLRVRVGMVFQSPNLFEGTVEHNVKFGPRLRGMELSAEQVEELLLRAGLEPSLSFLQRSVSELSGGEAQRVSIARALANSPEVLLMDEPTSSLDPSSTRKVEETVARLQHAEGLTVVLVSHSMPQVERLADEVGLLQGGHLVAVGPPMDLRESENPSVASFFTGELD